MFAYMNEKRVITIVAEKEVFPEDVEMVQFMANGLRAKDIAEKTGKNVRSVEAKIFTLKKKYNAPTPIGLVMLFYRNKLIV